jgi:outer membrane protein assembly factor BamB
MARVLRSAWFPAAVAALAALLVSIWAAAEDVIDAQARTLRVLITAGAALLVVVLWIVFFSPFPRRVRAGVAAAAFLAAALLRVEGTSGDLVPRVRWRWSGPPAVADVFRPGADVSRAADFPRFLGPSGDARLPALRLDPDWTTRPPVTIWRREVGPAWSGFAAAGGRAFTQEQRGNDEHVVAYDLASGRRLWSHAYAARYATTLGGEGPRATPTVDGGRVYALGATGRLSCLDAASGAAVWSADLGLPAPEWGFAGSPLVEGGLVLVQAGPLLAFDRASGARAWSAGTDSLSYATPRIVTLDGRRQAVVLSQASCAGHDPVTGERLWRHGWTGDQPKAAPPVDVGGDTLVISGGYGVGAEAFRVAGGRAETLWTSKKLKSKFASIVLRDGFLYGLDDGRLGCLRADTGERVWAGSRYGHGQLLLAGDLLLVTSEDGEVAIVDADPAAFRERARLKVFEGKLWNPPALAGPFLLVRTDREAACLELPTR